MPEASKNVPFYSRISANTQSEQFDHHLPPAITLHNNTPPSFTPLRSTPPVAKNVTKHSVKQKTKAIDFEKSLAELENLVARMEKGDSSLEDSLKDFERGIELTRNCQTALTEAEQKVQILLKKNGKAVDFDSE
jgi:exodeoxyribonuclease VII small subunit